VRTPSVVMGLRIGGRGPGGGVRRWTWTRWTQWTRWTTGWAKRCSDGRMPDEARASGVTQACRSTATEPRACGRRRRVRTLARRAHQRPPSTRRPPPLGPQGPLGPQATPVCAPRRSARRPPAPCPKPRETPEAPAPEPSACGRKRRVRPLARLPKHQHPNPAPATTRDSRFAFLLRLAYAPPDQPVTSGRANDARRVLGLRRRRGDRIGRGSAGASAVPFQPASRS